MKSDITDLAKLHRPYEIACHGRPEIESLASLQDFRPGLPQLAFRLARGRGNLTVRGGVGLEDRGSRFRGARGRDEGPVMITVSSSPLGDEIGAGSAHPGDSWTLPDEPRRGVSASQNAYVRVLYAVPASDPCPIIDCGV
ncbi:hypothetical protein AAE478_004978 [Parahypoxylon ruwenzoriense]